MTEWFQGLDTLEKVYWITALISSLFFVVVILFTFIGGDADEMGDSDFDGGIDFQFFTIKNLVGFFTVFSWAGLACTHGGLSNTMSIVISLICGTAMMFAMGGLFYFLRNLVESGELKMSNAINQVGEVYLTIGNKRSGIGKIQIKVQGSLRELEALTDSEKNLVRGDVIKVTQVISDEILLVEKV